MTERQEDYHCTPTRHYGDVTGTFADKSDCYCLGDGCCNTPEASPKVGWTQRLRLANAALKESDAILNEILGPLVKEDGDVLKAPGCQADALGCEVWEVQHLAEHIEKRLRNLMERF